MEKNIRKRKDIKEGRNCLSEMEQKGGKEHESNKTHGGERDMKQSFEEHSERNSWHLIPGCLNFWRRNDVFLILAHPVYKM